MSSPYLVPVARLLRDAPSSFEVEFDAPFDEPHEFAPRGPVETDVFPESLVHVKVRVESFSGGMRARGRVEAPWHGVCRRCSAPVLGRSDVAVNERFVDERAVDDEESYLIEHGFIDLAPLAHDAILLDSVPTAAGTSTTWPVTARHRSTHAGLHWTDSNLRTRSPRGPLTRNGFAR